MAEIPFADRLEWFDAIVSGSFRGSDIRVAWAIVQLLDERTNAAIFTQGAVARRMGLSKETAEDAVRILRRTGYIATDICVGPGQANAHRLAWPHPTGAMPRGEQ
ncbi:MAG TPA: hypothetical protein VNX29_16100 [Kaistia sp.]|nr:hypothetical protein [Kaistia sp.]